jgi:L-fuculose-phosphate aldolase
VDRHHQAKRLVLETCLHLAEKGFLPATGGNVALRVSTAAFAVTPSAMDYHAMSADDICILDLETLDRIEGDKRPSVESGLHACLLRFRPDFVATIHTHQPLASAVSLLGVPLSIETDPQFKRGTNVPLVPYAPSGTRWLLRVFGKCLRPDVSAYLLRNHGLVCGGNTIEDACQTAESVERAAARFLRQQIKSRQASVRDAALLDQALAAVE